ncbi:MAG: hypothetical protein CM1200mP3_08690 [Chloroflexota bacterium]|nr:MAG: hypothetical protein CM1200mP3_08690 [Chloroflexota bacterium]
MKWKHGHVSIRSYNSEFPVALVIREAKWKIYRQVNKVLKT